MPEKQTTDTSTERYEVVIGNTTFRVITKYTGDKPFLDYIKAAIRRDVETAVHRGENFEESA